MLRPAAALLLCGLFLAGCDDKPTASPTPPAAPASVAPRPIQARWWEWAAAEPEATNPVADRTGRQCARNQPGDVWFLAGTFGGEVRRQCTVPLGVPLVAPALNLVGETRQDCSAFMTGATGSVQVDGREVRLDRPGHEAITFTAGPGNPVTRSAGETSGMGCGLWARIDPPAAGEHLVTIHGRSGTFEVYVQYQLVVKAGASPGAA